MTANPSYTPCEDDAKQAASLDVNFGLLRVQVAGLQAGTEASDDEATSTARLSTTRISTIGLTVELGDSPPSLARLRDWVVDGDGWYVHCDITCLHGTNTISMAVHLAEDRHNVPSVPESTA